MMMIDDGGGKGEGGNGGRGEWGKGGSGLVWFIEMSQIFDHRCYRCGRC